MERKTKEYLTGEKVKMIEIIFYFACLQAECAQGNQFNAFTGQSLGMN